jgi:hypothetical protein
MQISEKVASFETFYQKTTLKWIKGAKALKNY